MKFAYKAITKDGQNIEGEAEARDKFDLAQALKAEGKTVVFAEEIADRKHSLLAWMEDFVTTVSLRDRIMFMRNLSAMIEAGLPLTRALGVLEKQTSNKKFKAILKSVTNEINKGSSLSVALSAYPRVFSSLATSMIKAGEESGQLPESLQIIGEHLERSYLLRRRVRGAMMYPSIVLTAMLIIGVLMMIYIVPTLTGVFEELDAELPATTQFIIALSKFLEEYTLAAFALLLGFMALLYFSAKSKSGKRAFDQVFLRLPVIGTIVKQVNSARTARTMSSLLSSGVQMVQSLAITEGVVQNVYYKEAIRDAGARIQKGTTLSQIFNENEDLYPILMSEMVAVGEETGRLSDMLLRVAVFYEGEVEQKTKNMSTIIEPILMIVVGIGVGFFAVSMITPLYSVLQGI